MASKNIHHIKLNLTSTIKEAMRVIDTGGMKIAIIVDDQDHLIGVKPLADDYREEQW